MLSDRLKKLRYLNHLNQADVAKLLSISRSAYAMYENNKRQIPYDSLIFLADYYKVSLDYLLERTDEPELSRKLTDTEKRLLKQFRQIDDRGQEAVLVILRYEYARVSEKKSLPPK